MIKLIVFDLWGTLAYEKVLKGKTSQILEKTKKKIREDKFVKIFENSVQTKKWESEFSAYKNLCKNMGLETTKENVELIVDICRISQEKTKLYKHSIPMIKKLKKKGYKIGLISNSSVFAIDKIKEKTNLMQFIDFCVFSYDVGKIKPDLKLFKEMLKISKFKAQEVVMVGDNFKDDIESSRKVGLNAIHYKNYPSLKKEFKQFQIDLDKI
jgi:putative hydrolase of the HAD superfamily